MARLCPSLPPHAATNVGEYAELDLLQTLERGLSNAYTLFHSVDWSRGAGEKEQHGEIDIVVLNQAGDVLLIEVKSGKLDFQPEGLFKTYGAKTKDIKAQVGPNCQTADTNPVGPRTAGSDFFIQVATGF